MADDTVTVTTPPVSSKISAIKGVEVLVQVAMGYLVSYVSIKCAAKLGMPIDLATQSQLVLWGSAVASGLLHGAYNWITHKWSQLDLGKKLAKKLVAAPLVPPTK
jgi:hypothetical protein